MEGRISGKRPSGRSRQKTLDLMTDKRENGQSGAQNLNLPLGREPKPLYCAPLRLNSHGGSTDAPNMLSDVTGRSCLLSGERHYAGSSDQNSVWPTEFPHCSCSLRLRSASISRGQFRDELKTHFFLQAYT